MRSRSHLSSPAIDGESTVSCCQHFHRFGGQKLRSGEDLELHLPFAADTRARRRTRRSRDRGAHRFQGHGQEFVVIVRGDGHGSQAESDDDQKPG